MIGRGRENIGTRLELVVSPIVTRFFAGLIIVPRATTTLDTIVELPAINGIAIPFPPPPSPRGTSRTWQVVRSSDFSPRPTTPQGEGETSQRVPRPRPSQTSRSSTQFFSRDEISADFQNDASNFFILPFPLTISKSTVSQENHEYC